MEYIKNGNWIEFNNIVLDTLIFTRRTVVILLLYMFLMWPNRHTSIKYWKANEIIRQRKKRNISLPSAKSAQRVLINLVCG